MLSSNCSKILIRNICGSPFLSSKYLTRESRFMNKILSRNSTKKHHKVVNVATPLTFSGKNGKVINTRRVAVLNKLFMKYITDILSTGNIDPLLVEFDIDISKVAITPDFLHINVFWFTQSLNNEDIIEQHLLLAAPKIHHELTQLNLMGFVPKICFIKDRKKSQIEELDRLFQTLNYRETEEDGNEDVTEAIISQSTYLLPMISNIYGLDHEKIMRKIVVAKGKQVNKLKMIHKEEESSLKNSDSIKNNL